MMFYFALRTIFFSRRGAATRREIKISPTAREKIFPFPSLRLLREIKISATHFAYDTKNIEKNNKNNKTDIISFKKWLLQGEVF